MSNLMKFVVTGILGVVLILGAVAFSFFRTPAQATAPIEAIPLGASTTEAATIDSPAQATQTMTDQAPAIADQPTPADSTDATPATTDTAAEAGSTSGVVLAQIVPEESEVRFIIDEVLNGAPKTVVGTTNQVAGELAVNPNDPAQTRVGVIQVNARTLATDSDMRNRTIANRILESGEYEFITFTPKQLVGLPTEGSVGQNYTFQVVGDLTIRDVTREVTFDVAATPQSGSRLEGTASTTIRHGDFGITIPSVRQVASVSEDVRIEIDFVAAAT